MAPLIRQSRVENLSTLFANLHAGHYTSDNENVCNLRGLGLTSSGYIRVNQVIAKVLQAQETSSSEQDIFNCLICIAKFHSALWDQYIHGIKNYHADERNWQHLALFSINVHRFRSGIRAYKHYAKREFGDTAYQTQLEYTREYQEDSLAETQELETRLRNELQVNVSLSSLEESRLSIEEGKRIRLSKSAAHSVLIDATSFS